MGSGLRKAHYTHTTLGSRLVEAEAVRGKQPDGAKQEDYCTIFSVDSSRRAGIRGVPMRRAGRVPFFLSPAMHLHHAAAGQITGERGSTSAGTPRYMAVHVQPRVCCLQKAQSAVFWPPTKGQGEGGAG